MCCSFMQLNSGQVSQLAANLTSTEDDGESKLPDCILTENGLELTDLGRMQVRISNDTKRLLSRLGSAIIMTMQKVKH